MPLHLVIDPIAVIFATVSPAVDSPTFNLILTPITTVDGCVVIYLFALSMFHASNVVTRVYGAIDILLNAMPVLQIVLPATLVHSSIHMCVNSMTLRQVTYLLPLVYITIGVFYYSLSTFICKSDPFSLSSFGNI